MVESITPASLLNPTRLDFLSEAATLSRCPTPFSPSLRSLPSDPAWPRPKETEEAVPVRAAGRELVRGRPQPHPSRTYLRAAKAWEAGAGSDEEEADPRGIQRGSGSGGCGDTHTGLLLGALPSPGADARQPPPRRPWSARQPAVCAPFDVYRVRVGGLPCTGRLIGQGQRGRSCLAGQGAAPRCTEG